MGLCQQGQIEIRISWEMVLWSLQGRLNNNPESKDGNGDKRILKYIYANFQNILSLERISAKRKWNWN